MGDGYNIVSSEAMSNEYNEDSSMAYKIMVENNEVIYLIYSRINMDGDLEEFSIYEYNILSNGYEIMYEINN